MSTMREFVDLSAFDNVLEFQIDENCLPKNGKCHHWVKIVEKHTPTLNSDGSLSFHEIEFFPAVVLLDQKTICAIYRQRYGREPIKHFQLSPKKSCQCLIV